MAFVKQTLSPFSTRAADPLFDFEEPYIQYGVISGQSYTAEQVSYGLPKPSYLQIAESSNTVTVVGSADTPVRMVFALGLHDAYTGGEVGAWRSFTGKSAANSSVTVSVNGSAWIYAEVNENGEPNNLNAWTIDYYSESSVGRTYTTSRTEPTSPANGDVWFDVVNNKLFKYSTDSASWEYKKRVYLGEAGVGDNGYLYSIQSWYPNRGYADFEDSKYVYFENPWRHYDGVSFTTNGQYTAIEAANWANNATIGQAVAGNLTALNAIANSASAMDNVVQSANTTNAIANSSVAIQALEANTSAIAFIVNSAIATESLVSNTTNFLAYVANSSGYINAFANSSGGGLEFIANSSIAQGLILAGSQNATFSTVIANNAAGLAKLAVGTASNILYELIGTTSYYSTLSANSEGQLLRLQDSVSGPILAIGGNTVTEITDGGVCYRVHTYTGTGAFNLCSIGSNNCVQVLAVAGGGGGRSTNDGSGGGGGGVVFDPLFKLPTTSTSCTISVGGGGGISTAGSNTTAFGLTAFYGGGGGNVTGAGAGGQTGNSPNTGDSDGQQPTLNQSTLSGGCASPLVVQHGCGSVGCSGGAGAGTTNCNTGDPPPNYVKGGAGVCYSISGSTLWYGGGGGGAWPGGAIPNSPGTSVFGLGGKGGGGHGITGGGSPGLAGASPNVDSAPATCFDGQCAAPFVGQPADILKCGAANRGGGGGGNHHTGTPPYPNGGAGAGGSGVAIIRYPISIS